MVILLIGPSGVGKSDYGKHAANTIPGCQFFDLDCLVRTRTGTPVGQLLPKIGNDRFLRLCRDEVAQLSHSDFDGVVLVAVGAGALQSLGAIEWIAKHSDPTIAVMASAKEVYERGGKRNENRTPDQFKTVEYSANRQKIYDVATYQCSVSGLSLEGARSRFADLIRHLQAAARSRDDA